MRQRLRALALIMPAPLLLTGCSESIQNAGYNTLLGMGMAFTVLIIIAIVIRILPIMTGAIENRGSNNEKIAEQAINKTVEQIEKKEEAVIQTKVDESDEIAAVIAAAVAAYEADTGLGVAGVHVGGLGAPKGSVPVIQAPEGYVGLFVRSIRRAPNSKWK